MPGVAPAVKPVAAPCVRVNPAAVGVFADAPTLPMGTPAQRQRKARPKFSSSYSLRSCRAEGGAV